MAQARDTLGEAMIESALYFLLGFLCALMLALMAAPAVWRRSSQLTRRRIANAVPLSVNEIQADKDRLRAEFAMSTRRLEMSIQNLRERAASQLAEIGRNRQELRKLAADRSQQAEAIKVLEQRETELRAELAGQAQAVSGASSEQRALQQQIEERAAELAALNRKLAEAESIAAGRQIELVARETAHDQLADELDQLRRGRKEFDAQYRALEAELAATREALNAERRRTHEDAGRLDRTSADMAEREQRLAQREQELARLKERIRVDDTVIRDLEGRLVAADKSRIEVETELAQTRLRLSTLMGPDGGAEAEKAREHLQSGGERIARLLAKVTRERDDLIEKLRDLDAGSIERWEVERRENAALREQMNDLAAQVVRLTQQLEGPRSPIPAILRDTPTILPPEMDEHRTGMTSLAERIRKLQQAASVDG